VREVLANPYYRERLAFTTFQALLSTLLTVALALPGRCSSRASTS
jgi:ABC-type Fe3+ transport system permease subunit